ncbi:MAG: hypothetical protein HKO64_05115 [Xanthomonadales bacterium]|nr:hypothetical protein [Xanthomonadales bacterium]
MNNNIKVKLDSLRRTSTALLMAGLVAGCATTPGEDSGPVSVEDRAQARWNHLLANEVTEAYAYLSPGYRSSVSLNAFQNMVGQKKVGWTAASVVSSECEEISCKVRIMLNYRLMGAVPGVQQFDGKQLITENWVNSDGQWWHIPPN